MSGVLMVWQGVVKGSWMGRDDGHPKTEYRILESVEALAASYRPDAKYYRLEPVDARPVVEAVRSFDGGAA